MREEFQDGHVIFRLNDDIDKLYILLSGEVEIFLSKGNDIDYVKLETLDEPGCIFGQYTVMQYKDGINYGLKVLKQARFLTLKAKKIYNLKKHVPGLEF